MIDKALGLNNPKRESFYFVLLVNSIRASSPQLEAQTNQVKFAVYKGPQLFNQTRQPQNVYWDNHSSAITKCQLAFFLPFYDPNRKVDFIMKMFTIKDQSQIQVGDYTITSNNYIDVFMKQNNNKVEVSAQFDGYTVDFFIFIERTRSAVDKIVKQYKSSLGNSGHNDQKRSSRLSQSQNKPRSYVGSERLSRSRKTDSGDQFVSKKRLAQKQIPQLQTKQQQKQENGQQQQLLEKSKKISPKQRNRPANISSLEKKSQKRQKQSSRKEEEFLEQVVEKVKDIVEPITKVVEKIEDKVQPIRNVVTQNVMEHSGKISSSIRLHQVEMKQKLANQNPVNWKIILFLIVSMFLMYQAMVPSRKCPYKKGK